MKLNNHVLVILMMLGTGRLCAQLSQPHSKDSICSHKIFRDKQGKLLAWFQPGKPGAAYDKVIDLAAAFIKDGVPEDSASRLKIYYVSCCFDGPHMNNPEQFRKGKTQGNWIHDPACVFAGMVRSLAIDYYRYSGDSSYVRLAGDMLDFMLARGTTPAHYAWPFVPYASADRGDTQYAGSVKWISEGMRGDGRFGIEPDKIAEMGNAYLNFYKMSGVVKYLNAAVHCADALAEHVLDLRPAATPFSLGRIDKSPWPFRVNAQNNGVISEYCSNVIEPIRLFDALLSIKQKITLSEKQAGQYTKARQLAWDWLFSKNGPMVTYAWNGYFEDIPNDSTVANRVQITPMETARYLIQNYKDSPRVLRHVPLLLHWVKTVFSEPDLPAINEQTWCFVPMGSHTARFASVCALWYNQTHDPKFREDAYRYFNYASYMTDNNGVVRVGNTWPGTWFADGYGDYIRHFFDGMDAVPAWAPDKENHLVGSGTIIQSIQYTSSQITYRCYDEKSTETFRLITKPLAVWFNGKKQLPGGGAWQWEPLAKGGILRISHQTTNMIKISLK